MTSVEKWTLVPVADERCAPTLFGDRGGNRSKTVGRLQIHGRILYS